MTIIVFSASIDIIKIPVILATYNITTDCGMLFLSTHKLFENETLYLKKYYNNSIFLYFGELLTDKEMEECDLLPLVNDKVMDEQTLYQNIKILKNKKIVDYISLHYKCKRKYILSTDLGIEQSVFEKAGYRLLDKNYHRKNNDTSTYFSFYSNAKYYLKDDSVSIAFYRGKKYVWLGMMNRIKNYLSIEFEKSSKEYNKLANGIFEEKDTCVYLVTLHEALGYKIPDDRKYILYIVQDGYLPPNYTAKYVNYYNQFSNVKYLSLDIIGKLGMEAIGAKQVEILPFIKKQLLPMPCHKKKISTILIAANCSGDWSALINRSDEDLLFELAMQIAKKFPFINVIYRPHPQCIHPFHNGSNFIERVNCCLKWSKITNLSISFQQHSLDDDIVTSDVVISEYSHSLIEAAYAKKIIISVNLTNRRNFFQSINDLGFPHCKKLSDIENLFSVLTSKSFEIRYNQAINNYNDMIQGRLEQVSKQNKKNIIALLTGKGNNTLKSKNMLNILGHPVLFYPANEAKKSLLINDFFCSSENSDILTEASRIGYKKIVRPIELAQADSQHEDVIFHALNIMESIGNIPDILVVILANNVSIKVEWIDLCIKKILDDENISAVVPIYADNDHHPLRCKCIVNNRLQPYFQESANNVSSNRQDLPKCYFLAHNFWVINVGLMLKNRGSGQPPWKFMGNNIDYIIIDDSVDIHKESDVLLAENWLKNNHY